MAESYGSNPYVDYTGPGASGAGGATGPATMGATTGNNVLTGFSARYQPDQLTNIWSNPWAILPDVFQGMNTSGGGYNSLRDIGADPLTLYNIMQGRGNDLTGGAGGSGVGDYTNWLASLYKTLGTVGGRGFSASELLGNIFNPGATNGSSALQNVLTQGDASTQMRTLFNLAKDATNVGMNPLAARGYQSALARAGDTAINQMMKTNDGTGANNMPIYQLLKQIAPGLVPG